MASDSPRRGDELEEDLFGEGGRSEEEGEGEDLMGDNMLDDYAEDPENDRYDPEMLDDSGENGGLGIEARRAAEAAMDDRVAATRGSRRRREAASPTARGSPASSPGTAVASDLEASPGTEPRRKKRRSVMSPGGSSNGDDDGDDDVPESLYNLIKENWKPGEEIDARLEQRIRLCFKMFLKKFALPATPTEPYYPDHLAKMAEEYQMHLNVDYNHMSGFDAHLALWAVEDPRQTLPLLNQTLMEVAAKKFETYRDIVTNTDENELRVAITNFPIHDKIRELTTKAMNRLVCVNGVVTKRSNVLNQVKRLYLRCAKCNNPTGPFIVSEEEQLRPGSCIECQSRGPWRVDRQMTLYRNYQKIHLQESPSDVAPGKMPRSKEVILHGDMADGVRPGDDVRLTGVHRVLYDAATNARTSFPVFKTEMEAVHVQSKSESRLQNTTDESIAQILELSRSPNIREKIIASIAPSIYGMEYVKMAIAMSMFGGQRKEAQGKHRIRGDINTLIVGDPGLAKSQFLKYVEATFPKAVYTTGKGASGVGLTAALTRDERGEMVLEGGAMVLADDGLCLIDEFDKMNDQDRTSIHEAMEQQTISVSKAGIMATLKARCAVIAVANPQEGRYDPQQTFAQNVGLTDPILSRFDMLCVLKDEADPVKDECLADHVVCSHMRSHPEASADEKLTFPKKQLSQPKAHVEPIPQDLLQKYIMYARQRVFPKVMDLDKEKLANFYKDIRAEAFRSGGAPMTARHVESIIRIAEASARLELRQHVTSKDLDNAIASMLESFIQSQKHQVAEELRNKFKKYIVSSTPMADSFMRLVEKIFKDKYSGARLAHADELPADSSEVPLPMQDVVAAIERNDLDMDECAKVMESARFKSIFRESGGNLYRM